MQVIEAQQAQKIVEQLMKDIPFNINIMDNAGMIIASGDKARIGQQHSAAQRAITEKKTIEVYEDTASEKKGTNTPIVYNDNIIGVVGITGDPLTVSPFTKIVSSVVFLMIQEMADYKHQQKINNQKKLFLKKVMSYTSNSYDDALVSEGFEIYKINLLEKHYCVLSKNQKMLDKMAKEHVVFKYKGFYLCFLPLDKMVEIKDISSLAKSKHRMIIGEPRETFSRLIEDTVNAWYVADFFAMDSNVIQTQTSVFSFLFTMGEEVNVDVLNRIKKVYDDYYETLIEFAKNNCNYNETSKKLHIHRNTLAYRLERLYEITGLDPNVWFDLCKLLHYFITFYKTYLI